LQALAVGKDGLDDFSGRRQLGLDSHSAEHPLRSDAMFIYSLVARPLKKQNGGRDSSPEQDSGVSSRTTL
jgi:hypothetical protein